MPPPPLIKYMCILNTKFCSSVEQSTEAGSSYRSQWLSQFELNGLLFLIAVCLNVLKVFILSCLFTDAESCKAEAVLLYVHLFNNYPHRERDGL